MKKLEKLNRQLEAVMLNIDKVKIELKDTSHKSGRWFKTSRPSLDGFLLVREYARTKNLNTYVVLKPEHIDLFNEFKRIEAAKDEELARLKRLSENKQAKLAKAELYSINDRGYVVLTDSEAFGKYFNVKKLAKTLKISEFDADLLNSRGKTYVYAKTEDGKLLKLFHPSLTCNHLSIHVEEVKEMPSDEEHMNWISAPFSHLLGATNNNNHFVC